MTRPNLLASKTGRPAVINIKRILKDYEDSADRAMRCVLTLLGAAVLAYDQTGMSHKYSRLPLKRKLERSTGKRCLWQRSFGKLGAYWSEWVVAGRTSGPCAVSRVGVPARDLS